MSLHNPDIQEQSTRRNPPDTATTLEREVGRGRSIPERRSVEADGAKLALVGAVIIGRNEGERLRTCILSTQRDLDKLVYVDSASTDGSVALAKELGVTVVELDPKVPFTAARARNIGAKRLLDEHPEVAFIQFVDGDCEVVGGWIQDAFRVMNEQAQAAVVCGRRREREPAATVYNRLVDMEWDTPVGPAREFGGDALMRVEAYRQVGGYRDCQIAGEEPELAVRLRRAGWQIQRVDHEMTIHDIHMTRFGQWWRRNVRAGHALAERAYLNGNTPERDCVRERRSTVFWACLYPLGVLALALLIGWLALLLLLVYPVQVFRVYRYRRRHGDAAGFAWAYGFFCILGKWPNFLGLLMFHRNALMGRGSRIIEYRGAVAVTK